MRCGSVSNPAALSLFLLCSAGSTLEGRTHRPSASRRRKERDPCCVVTGNYAGTDPVVAVIGHDTAPCAERPTRRIAPVLFFFSFWCCSLLLFFRCFSFFEDSFLFSLLACFFKDASDSSCVCTADVSVGALLLVLHRRAGGEQGEEHCAHAVDAENGNKDEIPRPSRLEHVAHHLRPEVRRHRAQRVADAADHTRVLHRHIQVVRLEARRRHAPKDVRGRHQRRRVQHVHVLGPVDREHRAARTHKAQHRERLPAAQPADTLLAQEACDGRVQKLARQVRDVRRAQVRGRRHALNSEHLLVVRRVPVGEEVRAIVEGHVAREDRQHSRLHQTLPQRLHLHRRRRRSLVVLRRRGAHGACQVRLLLGADVAARLGRLCGRRHPQRNEGQRRRAHARVRLLPSEDSAAVVARRDADEGTHRDADVDVRARTAPLVRRNPLLQEDRRGGEKGALDGAHEGEAPPDTGTAVEVIRVGNSEAREGRAEHGHGDDVLRADLVRKHAARHLREQVAGSDGAEDGALLFADFVRHHNKEGRKDVPHELLEGACQK
eukprot:Rhum_TRINITY_DN2907_c0_g2::Rhum_TRINITY_DN2907_c0_g2_i1::g.8830::m.8830